MLEQCILIWSLFRVAVSLIQLAYNCFASTKDVSDFPIRRDKGRTSQNLYQATLLLIAKTLLSLIASPEIFLSFLILEDIFEIAMYRHEKEKKQQHIIAFVVGIGTSIILLAFHFFYEPHLHIHSFLIH